MDKPVHVLADVGDVRLTTAEALLVALFMSHRLNGTTETVLSRELWVKPQLEALASYGLLSWGYDDHGDFRVAPTPLLLSASQARVTSKRSTAETARDAGAEPTMAEV